MNKFIICAALVTVSGCVGDPAAPSAAGTVSLAASIDSTQATTLEIRACPLPPTGVACVATRPEPIAAGSLPADGGFPRKYSVQGQLFGASDTQDWQVIAWLAHGDAGTNGGPLSGEAFGHSAFQLKDCSAICGKTCFCGGSNSVDVLVDTVSP